MLRRIIKVRNEMIDLKDEDSMRNASGTINWLEYYYKEIIIILETFFTLNKHINNLH